MVVVHSYWLAIVMCVVTMICWGSWANTQKLTGGKWPFQLFYWDYSIGIILLTLIVAFTMGSSGEEGRAFLVDIKQASSSSLGLALLSGAVFNIANILLVAAIDIAGMAVAFPVAIGLALVIGVVVNYIAMPIGNPTILFLGVFLVFLGIIIDAIAYKMSGTHAKKSVMKGIVISIIAGILMGYFYRFLAASISENYTQPVVGQLTPYTAAFVFSIGLFLSNFIFNTFMMYKPLTGEAVTFKQYFSGASLRTHLVGVFGGMVWCLGLSFNLIAASSAGFAISYGLGQGATMIAAAWGVFVWKEFAGAPPKVNKLIAAMFLLYLIGLILIIVARNFVV